MLKGPDKTLVVFIDNLDGCLPDTAISTLKAVRLFLFMPRTALVVAANEFISAILWQSILRTRMSLMRDPLRRRRWETVESPFGVMAGSSKRWATAC